MAKKKTSKRRGSAPVKSLGARGKKAAAVKGGTLLTSVTSPRGSNPPEPDRLQIGMTDPPEPDRIR